MRKTLPRYEFNSFGVTSMRRGFLCFLAKMWKASKSDNKQTPDIYYSKRIVRECHEDENVIIHLKFHFNFVSWQWKFFKVSFHNVSNFHF